MDVTVPQSRLPDGGDLLRLGFAGAPTDLDEGHHSLALLAQPEQVQVWPLTQSFPASFFVKIIDLLGGGQCNDPSLGKHFSPPFFPATPSCPSRTLEGLFELTRHPSRAFDSPRVLLQEL